MGDQMTKKKMPATRSSVGGHVRAKGSQVDVEKCRALHDTDANADHGEAQV